MPTDARSTIFISHANPSDNDFVVWLGSRLSTMGYLVWADLNDLRGGHKLWTEIESVIRKKAAKVLVVTSKNSRASEGVEKEIIIAQGIEKELGLENFILQLKIDDLPFTQLPPQLNNQFVYDFKNNWGKQLEKLAEDLEVFEVPRSNQAKAGSMFSDFLKLKGMNQIDGSQAESAFSSWLNVNLPELLYSYPAPREAKTQSSYLESAGFPAIEFKGAVYTFAIPETVEYSLGFKPRKPATFDTQAFLGATTSDLTRLDRVRILNALVNQAWSGTLSKKGLNRLDLSNETAFFVGADPEFKVRYIDPLGRKTAPVKLVGKTKRGIYNIAISATSALTPFHHLETRMHVGFTKDGHKLIAEGERATKLRNSFCRSFWNDRWRRVYFALVQYLSDSEGRLFLETGGTQPIEVSEPRNISVYYAITTDPVEQNAIEDDGDLSEFDTEDFEFTQEVTE